MSVEEIKQKGNSLYKEQKFHEAIEEYTKGLEISLNDPILLSNRSVAYWKLGCYENALSDAELCIQTKPDWVKGYLRKLVALNSLEKYDKAKETAVKGFTFNDLKLSKDFVGEWLKASRVQVDHDVATRLSKRPYYNFYPDGVDLISNDYCSVLLRIIEPLMPSLSQGVLGISHRVFSDCLENILQLLHSLLAEFNQLSTSVFSDWIEKIRIDVDAFNLLSKAELMQALNEKTLAVASWLREELHTALVPIIAPTLLLVPLAALSRSFCLRCMNTGHFTLEYLAHATLAFFEDCIFDQPLYISTSIALFLLILYSYGSIEIWTTEMIEIIQVTIVKIQRLLEEMPKTTKNYDSHIEEYEGNLSVFLDMKIDQISESKFSHNPGGPATDLEHLFVVCRDDPSKALAEVEKHLQEILNHQSPRTDTSLILHAQELFLITGIFVKLNDTEKASEIYAKGFSKAVSILWDLVENGLATVDEIHTAVGSLRHFALCGASFLIDSKPNLAYDAFLKWKSLYSEAFSVLIRLGLRANNRVLFQVLSDPLIQKDEKEQIKAFNFHQMSEKVFIEKNLPHVFHALLAQTQDQIRDVMETSDVILDYIFDIFHPTSDDQVTKEEINGVAYVCVLKKSSSPMIFKLDMSPVQAKFANRTGLSLCFDEMQELCAELSKVIFPAEVRKILENKTLNRLCIGLDSYLHDVPIEACPWESSENGTLVRLCQRFEIIRVTSPRELLRENIIASLRFIFNPTLEVASTPSILDISSVLKAMQGSSLKLDGSFQDLAKKAIAWCGHTQESLKLETNRLLTVSYGKDSHVEISPILLQAMQHSMDKNKKSLQRRIDELKLQVSGQLRVPTFSLNTKCYIIGNPKYNLTSSTDDTAGSVGCISSLVSLFGLASISSKPATICIDQLPETQREVETIMYILSLNKHLHLQDPLTQDDATIGSLLALESPFIVHVATHGYMKSSAHTQAWQSYWNDTSSALLLAGSETYLNGDYSKLNFHINIGCLTPAAVCAINLEGSRLAFISACCSGIGTKPFHETAQSLLQAFRGAGAQSVISSLWNVNDSATADFASLFYNHLVQEPTQRPSHALFLTQKHLLEQKEPFSVYASFTCSGLDLPLNPSAATEAQTIQMVRDQSTVIIIIMMLLFSSQTIFKLSIKCKFNSKIYRDLWERNALLL